MCCIHQLNPRPRAGVCCRSLLLFGQVIVRAQRPDTTLTRQSGHFGLRLRPLRQFLFSFARQTSTVEPLIEVAPGRLGPSQGVLGPVPSSPFRSPSRVACLVMISLSHPNGALRIGTANAEAKGVL
jgi:hypothetical protein